MMRHFCTWLLLLFSLPSWSQESGETWEQVYQEMMGVEDADEESGWEENYELLQELAEHPIDINQATREELEQLPFLSDQQVMDLIEYRDRYGPLRSKGEFRMVRSMDYQQIRLLPFFVYVGEVNEPSTPLVSRGKYDAPNEKGWQRAARRLTDYGHHTITATGRIPFYERRGDQSGYAGYPYRHWLRYEYNYNQLVKAGIGGSQDAGEPFFAGRNKWGYDTYTYYLQLRKLGPIETLVAGKFKVSTGLGLVLNNSFSLGKVITLQNLGRQTSTLRAHTSRSEGDYFQGAGATVRIAKPLTLTAFASYRPVDGTLNSDGTVATLTYNGYHRTDNELLKKHNTHLTSAGGSISLLTQQFRLGVNAVFTHIDRSLEPNRQTLFRRHYAHGRDFINTSLDYRYRTRRLSASGETAVNQDGAIATLNMLSIKLSESLSAMLLQRFYSYRYTALHAHSFGSGGHVQNESGAYVGLRWHAAPRLSFLAYADYAYSPWARYLISESSRALDFFLQSEYMVGNWRVQARGRVQLRQRDNAEKTGLIANNDYRGRLTATYSDNHSWTVKTQFDMAKAVLHATDYGWMLSQHATYRHQRWQFSAMAAYFDTDSYQSRVYAYEQQLPGNFLFPVYFGQGLRLCSTAVYEPSQHLRLAFKLGYTNYFDRTTIGTGLQQIDRSSMTDLDLQLRWRF